MSLQQQFLKDIESEKNKIKVVNTYMKKIKDDDINDELKVDIKTCNIYIEYATRKLITDGKIFTDRISSYIILYHPKLFEYICSNYTIEEVIKYKQKILSNIENFYNGIIKDNKYELCKKLLTAEFKDKNRNALEYCYFLTWAKFEKDWVDVERKYIIEHNTDDILCVNITYGLQNLDSIVMYNNIPDSRIPILTEKLVNDTVKYRYIPPTTIAKTPVSMYNKDFKPIKQFTTKNVIILIDYGNNYYTRCFLNNKDISSSFAKDVFDGKVKCNLNKSMLYDIVNKDIYNTLPQNCYTNKLDKSELVKKYNIMKKIIIESYSDKRSLCIKNILAHKDITNVLDKKELNIFKLYLKYLLTADDYNQQIVDNYCCSYIYDGLFESKNLMDNS